MLTDCEKYRSSSCDQKCEIVRSNNVLSQLGQYILVTTSSAVHGDRHGRQAELGSLGTIVYNRVGGGVGVSGQYNTTLTVTVRKI